MGHLVDSSISVLVVVSFPLEFGNFLFSLPSNVLHFVTKIFEIFIELLILLVVGLIVTLAHDLLLISNSNCVII